MESNIERNVIIPEIPPGTLEVKYEDWYKNVKNPPSQSDYNYEEFWALQERLCKEGCVTGGVFFNPYLYWHLNFWKTEVDYLDEHGKPQQAYRNPNLRDNEWQVFNGIWQAEKEQKGIPIGGIRRAGKDLLNSSKLWTPTGPKQIGDTKVGDVIFDRSGKLTTILEVAPQGVRPVYKMTLQDGRELFCGLDHNWIVLDRGIEKVYTTSELIRGFQKEKYKIPTTNAVKYKFNLNARNPYKYGKNKTTGRIPEKYKISSIAQRQWLLRGILEANNVTDHFKHIDIEFECEVLAQDVAEVYRSMGLDIVFGGGCVVRLDCENRDSYIESIEYVFDAETTCIMVDNKGRDFLTDHYTVTHNSVFEASYIGHGATFDQDSQNIIAGINAADIKLITDKIDKGLNNVPDYFKWQRIEENWTKAVSFGIRAKDNSKFVFSQILIRNLDDGNNEEAIAGTKPRKLIIDEGAKGRFIRALQAAIPGFTTPYGWTCSPIVTFTGGDAKVFHDAQELMMNPEAYNFLSFPHRSKPNVRHGLFLDMTYRLEAKEDSTLAEYLGQPKNKELQKIKMQVGNPEKARKVTEEIIEQRRLSGDRDAYLKERMYYPIEVEDVFLTSGTSTFNTEAIKQQIQFIKDKNIKGNYIELYHDGTGIKSRPSDKKPVPAYPTPKGCDTDAPIVMWEPPIADNKFALYVAGVDSYHKDGQTEHSDSLGAVYIYKRIYNITGDGFQDMLVASYVSRPESKAVWNEQTRLLIKYYNAYTLVENDEISFIDYMKQRNDAIKYLAPQPAWLKAVTKYSSQNQDFGVSRSSDKVQNFLESLTASYLDEVVHQSKDTEGSVISEILGVSRIYDIPLLQELLTYEKGKNADRYVSFSLALAQANDLNPVMNPKSEGERSPLVQGIISRAKDRSSLFSRSGQSILNTTKRRR